MKNATKDGVPKKIPYFDFGDYCKAREKYPEYFEWLNYPDKYVEQMLKQQPSNILIGLDEFLKYQDQVNNSFATIMAHLKANFPEI